jgi:hypothetical protein
MKRGLEASGDEIIAVDRREPDEEVFGGLYSEFIDVDTLEGQARKHKLLGSGAVHAVVVSVAPHLHVPIIKEVIDYVGETVGAVVVPKPVGRTPKEVRRIMDMAAPAEERLRQRGETHKPIGVHEHYPEKGKWKEFIAGLPQAMELFGQLASIAVTIQEKRTIESEGRNAVEGTLEDLGPHVVSLILGAMSTAYGEKNSDDLEKDRYAVSGGSITSASVDFLRYNATELKPGKDTGFVARTQMEVTDTRDGRSHVVALEGSGGKGLTDRKQAELRFADPITGERTATITVDFSENGVIVVDLPDNQSHLREAVAHLFPEMPKDNGYYYASQRDMREGFQSLEEAYQVTRILYVLGRRALSGRQYVYDAPQKDEPGIALEDVIQGALKAEVETVGENIT